VSRRVDDELNERGSALSRELGSARINEVDVFRQRDRLLLHGSWTPQLSLGKRGRSRCSFGEHIQKLLDSIEIRDDGTRLTARVGDGEHVPDRCTVGGVRLNENRVAQHVFTSRRLVELREEQLLPGPNR